MASATHGRLSLLLALLLAFCASSASASGFILPIGFSYVDTAAAERYANQPGTEIMVKQLINAPVGVVHDVYIQNVWVNASGSIVTIPGEGRGRVGLTRTISSLNYNEQIQSAGLPTDSNRAIATTLYKATPAVAPVVDQLALVRFIPVSKDLTEVVWTIKLVLSPEPTALFPDNASFLTYLEDTVAGILTSIASAFPAPAGAVVQTLYALPPGYSYVDTAAALRYARQPGHEVVVNQVVDGSVGDVFDLFIQNEWVNNSGSVLNKLGEGRGRVGLVRTVTALGYAEEIQSVGLPTDSATAAASVMYQIVVGVEPGVDQLGFVRFIPLSKGQTQIVWTIKLVLTPEPTALFPNSEAFYSFLAETVASILTSIASAFSAPATVASTRPGCSDA